MQGGEIYHRERSAGRLIIPLGEECREECREVKEVSNPTRRDDERFHPIFRCNASGKGVHMSNIWNKSVVEASSHFTCSANEWS